MTAYSKEVRDRIKELESEIESLKQNNIVIPGRKDMEELSKLTDVYAGDWNNHISWVSRMAVCGTVEYEFHKSRLKNLRDLSEGEAEAVANCMREVMDVLLKYARQIKLEGKNDNTAT